MASRTARRKKRRANLKVRFSAKNLRAEIASELEDICKQLQFADNLTPESVSDVFRVWNKSKRNAR